MDEQQFKPKSKTKKDIDTFKDWTEENASVPSQRLRDNNSKDKLPLNDQAAALVDLKTDEQKRSKFGLNLLRIIIFTFLLASFFGLIAFGLVKNLCAAYIVFAASVLLLLILTLPWIIGSIRKLPIYSQPAPEYKGGSLTQYLRKLSFWERYVTFQSRNWWFAALTESLQGTKIPARVAAKICLIFAICLLITSTIGLLYATGYFRP